MNRDHEIDVIGDWIKGQIGVSSTLVQYNGHQISLSGYYKHVVDAYCNLDFEMSIFQLAYVRKYES